MKVFWSGAGGLSVIQRLQAEGNNVRWHHTGLAGQGIVEKVSRFEPDMDEIVVIPSVGAGKMVEEMRRTGYKVLGGSVLLDALLTNDTYCQQVMRSLGVESRDTQVEGWFNGDEWVHHSFSTSIEDSKLLAGDIGPDVGGLGCVSFFYRHSRPKLVRETLLRLTPALKKLGHIGPIGIKNGRIKGGNLELSLQLLNGEIGRALSDLVKGQARNWKVSFDFAIGVLLTLPPFPYGPLPAEEIIEMPPDLWTAFHAFQVRRDDEGKMIATGSVPGFMSAQAPTVHEAQRLVYERISQVKATDLQYRNDIGVRAIREVPQILREVTDGNQASRSSDVGERSDPVLVDSTDDG